MIDDVHGSDIISISQLKSSRGTLSSHSHPIGYWFTVIVGFMMLIELRVKHLFWLA